MALLDVELSQPDGADGAAGGIASHPSNRE